MTPMNWNQWTRIKDDLDQLAEPVRAIVAACDLPVAPMRLMRPATHAHVQVGDVVITLYAPISVGVQTAADTQRELSLLDAAWQHGLPVPRLMGRGTLNGWTYKITEYIEGEDLTEILPDAEPARQWALGRVLGETLAELHSLPCPDPDPVPFAKAIESYRWDAFSDAFCTERLDLMDEVFPSLSPCWIYGDIRPDNLRLMPDQTLVLLDWGESMAAPDVVDRGSLLWTFEAYPHFLAGVVHGATPAMVVAEGVIGVGLHDFGGDLIQDRLGTAITWDDIKAHSYAIAQSIVEVNRDID